jgi:hypothetical protein
MIAVMVIVAMVVLVVGAILTVVGAAVAILTYTGLMKVATTDRTEAKFGGQGIDLGIATVNVGVVVCFIGVVILALVLWRLPRLAEG